MDEQTTNAPKKTTRIRKTTAQPASTTEADSSVPILAAPSDNITQVFDNLMNSLIKNRQDFDSSQKEIAQVKQDWIGEQKQHGMELVQQKTQEEVERKREQETYQYETSLVRKRAEDEFNDKKLAWEKDLSQRKQELENQKRELEELKKLTDSFDSQKQQAVREAQVEIEKELKDSFENENKLREQEIKAEKAVLDLKISNLESENTRQSKEIEVLKRAFDEATKQVKEIAVKVIESGSNQQKAQSSSEV